MKKQILYIITAIVLFASCEKEIDIEMPEYSPSVAIEGYIVNGMNPLLAPTCIVGNIPGALGY